MEKSRKRRCVKGKSCGATCINRARVCRVDAKRSLSEGLEKMAGEVGGRDSMPTPKQDSSQEFLDHVKNNSFDVPGRSFSGEDIAKMLNTAAEDLDGEARANIEKLRQFVVKDGQVVFVSTPYSTLLKEHGNDPKKAIKEASKWTMSPKFIGLLDKSWDVDKTGSVSKSLKDAEDAITRLQEWVKTLKTRIADRESKGLDSSFDRDSLKSTNSSLKTWRTIRRDITNGLVHRVMGRDDALGWTMQFTRYVVVNETPLSFSYDKSRKIDSRSIQEGISNTIRTRSEATEKTNPASLALATHNFAFSYNRPNANMSQLSNERILQTYVHEMGHQIHFRAGSSGPPADSVSLSRGSLNKGLTEYSTVNKFETFAEAFVAYTFNPKALKNADEPLYNWVRNTVDTALANAGPSASTP